MNREKIINIEPLTNQKIKIPNHSKKLIYKLTITNETYFLSSGSYITPKLHIFSGAAHKNKEIELQFGTPYSLIEIIGDWQNEPVYKFHRGLDNGYIYFHKDGVLCSGLNNMDMSWSSGLYSVKILDKDLITKSATEDPIKKWWIEKNNGEVFSKKYDSIGEPHKTKSGKLVFIARLEKQSTVVIDFIEQGWYSFVLLNKSLDGYKYGNDFKNLTQVII